MRANQLDQSLSLLATELDASNMRAESELVERVRNRINSGQFDLASATDERDLRNVVESCSSPRGYVEAVGGKLTMNTWANLLAEVAMQLRAAYPDVMWNRVGGVRSR